MGNWSFWIVVSRPIRSSVFELIGTPRSAQLAWSEETSAKGDFPDCHKVRVPLRCLLDGAAPDYSKDVVSYLLSTCSESEAGWLGHVERLVPRSQQWVQHADPAPGVRTQQPRTPSYVSKSYGRGNGDRFNSGGNNRC